MKSFDELLHSMTFDFFASGKHKIAPAQHLTEKNGVFLDVRSDEEQQTIALSLVHHMPVVHIPINEIPERLQEIPKDKMVGVFCSSGVRSTMVYFYLRARGFDKVRVIAGGYHELADELMPGKLLKQMALKGAEK